MCPECSVGVNRICSRLVIHSFGLSNALFLDMLVRFSSRLDMLLLGLSDALLHLIAILLLFTSCINGDLTLQYVLVSNPDPPFSAALDASSAAEKGGSGFETTVRA